MTVLPAQILARSLAAIVLMGLPTVLLAEEPAETVTPEAKAAPATLAWHSDYLEARREAAKEKNYLLIHFAANDQESTLIDTRMKRAKLEKSLSEFTLLRVPTSYEIQISGRNLKLISHSAFRHMHNHSGWAVIDLKNENEQFHKLVVTCLPFVRSDYSNTESLRTVLSLPPGTLTQRTMVYAVRMHPEAPASTDGARHGVLASEASNHSNHQASIRLQGHHNWNSRFQSIAGRVGGLPKEVCAESWPNETLLEAAFDCVDCWRQSSGHWSAVRSHHQFYGYDIKLGSNGIWYATGIFSGR